jgi:predicted phosphodiesterase
VSAVRVALISDLHGNELALEAVLAEIARLGADEIICLGDVATLGPRPRQVLARLRALGCRCIMGNHDEFLVDAQLIHTYTEAPIIVRAVDWCRAQLDAAELDFVRGFARGLSVELGDGATLALFHGSPRSHMEDILATTPPDELDRMLAPVTDGRGATATVMAGGHTHLQLLRQHRGILLVNPGSVGMPFREHVGGREPTLMAHAEFALVEARGGDVAVTLRRVALARAALRDAAAAAPDNPLSPALRAQYA